MATENDSILITALGTMAASGIVKMISECGEKYILFGADINPANRIVSSRDVDKYFVFPSAVENRNEYIKYILNFCKKHNVKYIFPTIDEEVYDISLNRALFEEKGIEICIPNTPLVKVCHLKNVFCDWIKNNEPSIYIKTYKDISDLSDDDFPVFIKPVEGRASIGCRIIKNLEDLQKITDLNNYIIQEYLKGENITVDIIRNAKFDQIQIIQRNELIRNKNGCGTAVKIIYNKRLEQICMSLAEKLDLNGIINAEFFMLGDDFKIIEINPRFSAGSIYSYMAGCNLAVNALKIAKGEMCVFENILIGKNYARRYEAYEL